MRCSGVFGLPASMTRSFRPPFPPPPSHPKLSEAILYRRNCPCSLGLRDRLGVLDGLEPVSRTFFC